MYLLESFIGCCLILLITIGIRIYALSFGTCLNAKRLGKKFAFALKLKIQFRIKRTLSRY
jgi:hypothetical protein